MPKGRKDSTGYFPIAWDVAGTPTRWQLPDGTKVRAWKDGEIGGIPICGHRSPNGHVCQQPRIITPHGCCHEHRGGAAKSSAVAKEVRTRRDFLKVLGGDAGEVTLEFTAGLHHIARHKLAKLDDSTHKWVLEQLWGKADQPITVQPSESIDGIILATAPFIKPEDRERWLSAIKEVLAEGPHSTTSLTSISEE
jgi:hypothetical protein